MSTLHDVQDDLDRLRAALGLLCMAAGDLGGNEGKAMTWGLAHAESVVFDLSQRVKDLRAEQGS